MTNLPTVPVILEGLKARAAVAVAQSPVFRYPIKITEGQTMLSGSPDTRDPFATLDLVAALMERGPVEVVDHRQRTLRAKVSPVDMPGMLTETPDGWEVRFELQIRVQQVISAGSVQYGLWDTGVQRDTGVKWR